MLDHGTLGGGDGLGGAKSTREARTEPGLFPLFMELNSCGVPLIPRGLGDKMTENRHNQRLPASYKMELFRVVIWQMQG